ncbi:MAG: hypothetical protein GX444_10460 [Myxococcales bacterium]|nr:hypothetical protein [Myxococcales bacterium]
MLRRFFWLGLLMAVILAASTALAGPVSSKLTPEELAKVKAGQIVVKNNIQNGSEKGYGVAYGIMKGSVDDFWKVIFDYSHYLEFYPRLEKVTPVSVTASQAIVTFDMDATIKTMTYTTVGTIDADRMGMTWVLDMNRPHKFFKANDGHWKLEQLEPGVILAEYLVSVSLDLGPFSGMATKIVNSMAKDDLPDVINCTRKRLESGGTWKRTK